MQKYKTLNLPDAFVFIPKKFKDTRGVFFENFNYKSASEIENFNFKIVQENISISKKNVLRGLHFQKKPYSQSKIISVIRGRIFDVIIDLRPKSPYFSKWESYILDDKLNETIYVPQGFAHGFLTLEDDCIVSYKVDNIYSPENECSIIWNDCKLKIDWPILNPKLSKKDSSALTFEENLNSNNFM